jgi:hypothetical protein
MRYPKLSALPLLIPGALYIAVALFWQSHDLYQIIGDEPHYLLISESIVRDGDLQVYDDSVTTTPVHLDNPSVAEPIRDVPHVAGESKGYSIHGISDSPLFSRYRTYWAALPVRNSLWQRSPLSGHFSSTEWCTVSPAQSF